MSVDQAARGRKLIFSGVGSRDVYNISAPFMDNGELVIAGRVEDRDRESSEVMFFVERKGEWVPRNGAPVFALQDPFFSFIGGQLVFGGVEVYFDGDDPHYVTSWCTVFYRGNSINELEPFAKGPLTMKDIRLVELENGRIGVFTRPMMVEGARALIGYTEIGSLEELTEANISGARLLRHQFLPEEWGGANEAHLLPNGIIGVLGHIARMEDNNIRHYYPMVFAYHSVENRYSPIKLIATRSMFPDGPAKRPDLVDVIFSGGLVRHKDGTASLYTGVSDAEAHVIEIPDPFLEYET
nr:DUF1861 family protein [Cohnella mopanensis]